ncbi:response regulator [Archangium minus]|uniref:Response regulator n=1 Tax=Archangium minus TaxID=83450 RepID=A0ABY9WZZ6_9BACT|nr:response regulator [Archangium violaceum]WNG48714.1 response regulator [Archangium minus]
MSNTSDKRRILIIDDSEAIHTDFRRILNPEQRRSRNDLDQLEEVLFGPAPSRASASLEESLFEVESAFQGQEGVAKVREAEAAGRPYSLVFLDYRMPPGWNGAETLRHLRTVSPALRVVLCSAYSDYSWAEMLQKFGEHHSLRELRKPFNGQEVRKLALSLTEQRDMH